MSKDFEETARARDFFPRGLFQPDGSFRFSMDALLLAAFAAGLCPGWQSLADLGSGAGPVAFGTILLRLEEQGSLDDLSALGLELQPELVEAARKNSVLLGLENIFQARQIDLEDSTSELTGSFDLVTANPPYRLPGSGRLPASPLRRAALFGSSDTLRSFVRAGNRLTDRQGLFCMVFPYSRSDELAAMLEQENMWLQTALPVVSGAGPEPSLVLLAVGKQNKGIASAVQKPLVLYERTAQNKQQLTASALKFCPFLACNAINGN